LSKLFIKNMKLIEKLSQSRRDFQGKYKCEFCHNIETDKTMNSYDNEYYHMCVIPNIKCNKCGKSTINQNREVNTPDMKYPEGWVV